MSQDSTVLEKWLQDEFAGHLATVFELMSGERPEVNWTAAEAMPVNATFRWRQPMPPLSGAIFVAGMEAGAMAAGQHILAAAGVEEGSSEELRSTFTETLGQALSSLAQSLTTKVEREVTCAEGKETTDDPDESIWAALSIGLGDAPITLAVGIERTLLTSVLELTKANATPEQVATSLPVSEAMALAAGASSGSSAPASIDASSRSQTFDLLLDVEMPVSVSFGKAQVALKEVLKLTTGSIVELNRAIAEPVDVVVNNCVIARGEVVVVEGNFGVRIREVVSRNERLKTLR